MTKNEAKEFKTAQARGEAGEALLLRTWWRDINGNSYQSAALYQGGEIVKVWGKDYQGVKISESVKALKADGFEFVEVITATRLRDFFKA